MSRDIARYRYDIRAGDEDHAFSHHPRRWRGYTRHFQNSNTMVKRRQ